jgi:hypothetical protein
MSTNQTPTPTAADIWNQLDAEDVNPPANPEPSPAPSPAPAAVADKSAQKTEAASEDPYATLPASIRDELVGLKTMTQQLGGRLRQAEGHIGNLTSQLKQAREVAKTQAPSASEVAAARSNPQAWKQMEEEYPEFFKTIRPALDHEISALRSEIAAVRGQSENPDILQRIDSAQRELTVEVRHPGWKERVQSPQFVGWLQSQPREVQMLAGSPDPSDAIRLLDLHSSAAKSVDHRQQRLNAAAAIPTGRTQSVRAKPMEEMTGAELWKYLDQIDAQSASTR